MLNKFNNCIFLLSNIYFWPRNQMGKISAQLFGNLNQDNFQRGIFVFNALLLKTIFIGSALSLGTLYLGLLCVLPFTNLQKGFNRLLSLAVSLPLYSAIILPNYVKFIFNAYSEIKAVHNDGIIKNLIRSSKLYYHLLMSLSNPKNYEYSIFFNENVIDQYRAYPKILELIKNFNLPLLNIKNWSLNGFLKESTAISSFDSFYSRKNETNVFNASNLKDLILIELNEKLFKALNFNNKEAIFENLKAIMKRNDTLNIENPLAPVNLKLDEAKLIKLLIDSPEDNFVELKACFNSIRKASRNTFISDNELAYHCVNKCEKIDKFLILLEFIDAHEFKKVLNLNFIAYAFLYNSPIAELACNKVVMLDEQVKHDKEDADLKEFCELADLSYSKDLTSNQIKTAYRKFCKENHPDKNSNDLDATEKFQKMQTCRGKLRHAF